MNKFFSIVIFFPVLFLLALLLSFAQYNQEAIVEMQELMVADSANSANDAALFTAQMSAQVDIYGRTTLDPDLVWEEYKRCFLRSMNLFSDKNMDLFEGYCPATIIAVNDGYFMRLRTLDTTHPSGVPQPVYKWSQKIPYARQVNSGGADVVVADTMNGSFIYGYVLSGATGGMSAVWGEDTPVESIAGGIHDNAAIAYELVSAMDYCIELENAAVTNNLWDTQRFYLPKELLDTVYYDAVTFKGLTLINLIQGFDMLGNKPVDYFTISNTQLVESKQYACYVDGGKPLYSPLDGGAIITVGDSRIDTVVSSKEQAAKLGYSPDPRYYQIPLP